MITDNNHYTGQIYMGGWNFAPRGSILCQGQILQIAQNTMLFSLLGSTFGGDGRTNFGVPDLRGRTPIHQSYGSYNVGQKSGNEEIFISLEQMPAHQHESYLRGLEEDADTTVCKGNSLANTEVFLYTDSAPYSTFGLTAISSSGVGRGAAHTNMQPYLAINYCICIDGVFPMRS